jgi:hypothetical protein
MTRQTRFPRNAVCFRRKDSDAMKAREIKDDSNDAASCFSSGSRAASAVSRAKRTPARRSGLAYQKTQHVQVQHVPSQGDKMTSTAVLSHLKKHGQLLDSEISAMTKIPLDEIRRAIEDLSRRGEISLCSVTRYKNGTSVEGLQCRISGYYPPAAPGRKPAH